MIQLNLLRKSSRLGLRNSTGNGKPTKKPWQGIGDWIARNLRLGRYSGNAQVAGGYLAGNIGPYASLLTDPPSALIPLNKSMRLDGDGIYPNTTLTKN